MSAIYDNWERLVAAVLKKELLWQLFHADSVSVSSDTDDDSSAAFSFSHLASSLDLDLDAVPISFSDLGWSASASHHIPIPPPSIGVEKLPTTKNDNSTPPRKRDLKIQVPQSQRDHGSKQRSYPLPLPPGSKSSSRDQERGEIVESPWKKGRLLGTGLLGGVYIGFNSEEGGMCAMKEVRLSSDGEKERSARMKENELVRLSRMRHPNIVRYYGSQVVGNKFYIYYEYMSRGSIYMILEQYGGLGELAIRSYTQQVLSGLAYLHSKIITHGNIKAANILIDPKGRVKLTNFGIEKQIAEKLNTSWMMDSPYWMAPEVIINADVRDSAADIWSLGCTVLEMATSRPPLSQYDGAMAMFKVAYHKELPAIPDHVSADCKDFLRQCLQWNPLRRATASQLLEHPFVKYQSPLRGRTPLRRPAVADSVKSQGGGRARTPHQLDPKSNLCRGNLSPVTPRSVLDPKSPVGSLLRHQQLTPPPPKSTPFTTSTANGAIQLHHLNQPMIHQESIRGFPKQSPNSNSSPSYWDPNIIQGMLGFSSFSSSHNDS